MQCVSCGPLAMEQRHQAGLQMQKKGLNVCRSDVREFGNMQKRC